MPIKTYRPITPTLRFQTSLVNDDLTTDKPHKPLLAVKQRTGGRRNTGDLTIRHHGGGHKQKLRLIDFKREKYGVPGRVATIEYDPNRSARIALVHYADGEKRYILQPVGLKVGATVSSGPRPTFLSATRCRSRTFRPAPRCTRSSCGPARARRWRVRLVRRLSWWPRKATTPCSSCLPARPARYWSSAWRRLARWATRITRMWRSARQDATAGRASARPTAASSMNPVDHPHGGGEGKTSGGRHPVTPWGQPTRGYKTRNNKRTDAFIVSRREK